ncbi:MAG: hypothetical protein Q8P76_02400 [bacterium]|nr:hypothetical protein [bacterium]
MENSQKLSNLLNDNLSKNEVYLEALRIIRKNSNGAIWLIGSGVYKTLLNLLYNNHYVIKDWDFIVEKITTPLKLENGWVAGETKHGNPKLKKDGLVMDLIALNNIHSITKRGLEPDIKHYLSGVPLTIQSIAFNVDQKILIGEAGIESLLNKTIGINNLDEYTYAESIYGDRYTTQHFASVLGFQKI